MINATFVKHAEKVFKGKHMQSRPTLCNLNVRDNKVVVTDSHRLYRLTSLVPLQDGTFSTSGVPYTDGNYPNTDKLIPDPYESNISVYVNVKNMYDFVTNVGKLHTLINSNNQKHITLEYDLSTRLVGTPKGADCFEAHMPIGQVSQCRDDNFNVNIQVDYLKDAFALLKDMGEKEAVMHFYNSNKPVLMTTSTMEIVLLPVRIY